MSVHRHLFFGLVGVSLLQVIYYYPQLPLVVASHFDASGAANGWSSRNGFFATYLVMVALLIGVFVLLPRWVAKRGGLGMKIPNRDFWLAPERRRQTHAFFRRQMLLMGSVHMLLAIITVQLAIHANLAQQTRLHQGMFWVLATYFVFLCAWLVYFYRHFRQP